MSRPISTPTDATESLPVIYRDDHLVAVNKPGGLLVHRSPIDRHETRFALQLVRNQIGQRVYPVHRLDKPTSGVLLFALSPAIARELSAQFSAHAVNKQYLAVVRGWCPQQGLIDHAIRDRPDKLADRHRQAEPPAREAQTAYRRLATVELPFAVDRYPQSRYSLVALQPRQGRKHQLRRHMKHLGYPMIGDAKYGKGVHNRFFQTQLDCDRLLLACTAMTLRHPLSGDALALRAPLGDSFARLVERFGWSPVVEEQALEIA
ncbi:tRNA pseudouridine(65) synthase TruC [Seongchinamella unica]|uniref:tRNA pseudouridine synthase C n=1 Tax=Seongchinamella unica TaxID=2547392 RepID=A0A4R5LT69_9GAMM|nr:tRNA pseudouridine(65) synthase TruC [Seongchinamella unica]TDG14138.1 tRNA pseudouridine(65) synthase TruC [Seongchinamella unica]